MIVHLPGVAAETVARELDHQWAVVIARPVFDAHQRAAVLAEQRLLHFAPAAVTTTPAAGADTNPSDHERGVRL